MVTCGCHGTRPCSDDRTCRGHPQLIVRWRKMKRKEEEEIGLSPRRDKRAQVMLKKAKKVTLKVNSWLSGQGVGQKLWWKRQEKNWLIERVNATADRLRQIQLNKGNGIRLIPAHQLKGERATIAQAAAQGRMNWRKRKLEDAGDDETDRNESRQRMATLTGQGALSFHKNNKSDARAHSTTDRSKV